MSQSNKPQNSPEANPSKKQKQEEFYDNENQDSDEIDDDDDVDYEDASDDMQIETLQGGVDVVDGMDSIASDFGSDGSNHGYSIATHFVKVQSSGSLADVKSLWQLAGTDAVSQSVKTLLEHSKPGVQRFSSIHAFEKVLTISSYLLVDIF